MELPNASSIDSYPSDQQEVRSITSIDDSASKSRPLHPISFARNSNLVESMPSPDVDPHRFVTSIEYLVDDPEISEAGNSKPNQPYGEDSEYGFIQKVAIDRNKLFKLHYNIQQPEKQLIEETLDHFQKKSNEISKQPKAQEISLPVRRKNSNVTTSSKNDNPVSATAKERNPAKKVPTIKETKTPTSNVCSEREGACDSQPQANNQPRQKRPSQRSHPYSHDKENIRPEQQQLLSARPMTRKLKTILQGLKSQEKPQTFGDQVSMLSRSPSVHNDTIPEEESTCVCDEILARLEESNLGLEAGLIKEIMDRLNTVNRQIQGFESQFRSLKSENQQLREKLMALEANQSSTVKKPLKMDGRDRLLLLRPQDSNNFAFRTHTSTRSIFAAKKAESEYRLQNTAFAPAKDRPSHFSIQPSDHSRPENFASALNKKVLTKTQQLKTAPQTIEPRIKRRGSHHSGLSMPFA